MQSTRLRRDSVRDVFARVLSRDHEVSVVRGFSADPEGITIRLRDHEYELSTVSTRTHVSVIVFVLTEPDVCGFRRQKFFHYSCPISQLGQLRKTALILLKKMQMREVYLVMTS